MRIKGGTAGVRAGAILAGVVLFGALGAGPALAEDPSDTGGSSIVDSGGGSSRDLLGDVTSYVTDGGGSEGEGSTSIPSVAIPSAAIPSVAIPSPSGETRGSEVELAEAPAAASPNALITIPSGITAFPSFPTGLPTIPGLPTDLAGQDPTVACSQVVSTLQGLDPTGLSGALNSPAAIFCGALGFDLPTVPGGSTTTTTRSGSVTETSYGSPYYDAGYGHRYYKGNGYDDGCNCTSRAQSTPVYSTQVASVPVGGVATGDGSYGP